MAAIQPKGAVAPSDFDLDITVVEKAPVIADLMNDTSDNCGGSCQSACSNSTCE
ncbi:FxLD family lanthipeptide [Streptomyces sp. NPDC057654]|uniref:FxLD family lanthipeptide n=1 Tax=Streptomyces sp. NPDC057654 TaxID=3346196 RepID=UPI00369CE2C0